MNLWPACKLEIIHRFANALLNYMELHFADDDLHLLHRSGKQPSIGFQYDTEFIQNYIVIMSVLKASPNIECLHKIRFLNFQKIPKRKDFYSVEVNQDFTLHFRLLKANQISILSIIPTKS